MDKTGVVVLWFLLSVFHIRISWSTTVGVKELMFWFLVTAFLGIFGSQQGGAELHPLRTWREEEGRWSSSQEPVRLSALWGWLSSLRRKACASLVLWVLFSFILFDFVGISKLPSLLR